MLSEDLIDEWLVLAEAPGHSVYPTIDLLFATGACVTTQWVGAIQVEALPRR